MKAISKSSILALSVLPFVLIGCNGDRTTRVIEGEISYQGKPIPFGRILLVPIGDTQASPAGTYISEGEYRIDGKGGVMFGTFKVEITGYPSKPNPRAAADRDFESGHDQYIPPRYNVQSQLELVVEQDSGPLLRDFDLQ